MSLYKFFIDQNLNILYVFDRNFMMANYDQTKQKQYIIIADRKLYFSQFDFLPQYYYRLVPTKNSYHCVMEQKKHNFNLVQYNDNPPYPANNNTNISAGILLIYKFYHLLVYPNISVQYPKDHIYNKLSVPKGVMEPYDRSPKMTAIRELYEETNISLDPTLLSDPIIIDNNNKKTYIYPCQLTEQPQLILDQEIKFAVWLSSMTIRQLLSTPIHPLNKIVQKIFQTMYKPAQQRLIPFNITDMIARLPNIVFPAPEIKQEEFFLGTVQELSEQYPIYCDGVDRVIRTIKTAVFMNDTLTLELSKQNLVNIEKIRLRNQLYTVPIEKLIDMLNFDQTRFELNPDLSLQVRIEVLTDIINTLNN